MDEIKSEQGVARPSKPMQLLLHIGTEKTGTTVIQNWCYENVRILRDHGFYLTRCLGVPNNRRLSAYFQARFDDFFLDHNIQTDAQKAAFFSDLVTDFDAELAEASQDCHTCIISSEHLSSRLNTPAEISELARFLSSRFVSVRVLCYFRDQESLRQSLYSTALINGFNASPDEFMADVGPGHYYFNYEAISRNWLDNFRPDSFEAVIYRRADFLEGDVRHDFGQRVGLPLNTMSFSERSANESLSALQTILLRLINSCRGKYLATGGVDLVREELVHELLGNPAFQVGKLVHGADEGINQNFKESNARFLSEVAGIDSGTFDSRPGRSDDAAAEQPSGAAVLHALEAALPLLARMYHDRSDLGASGRVVGLLKLNDSDVDLLRDVALLSESNAPPSADQALALMKLAYVGRPTGPVIQDFIARYERPQDGQPSVNPDMAVADNPAAPKVN